MLLLSAHLQARNKVVLRFDHSTGQISIRDFTFSPRVGVRSHEQLENVCVLLTEDFDLRRSYTVFVHGIGSAPVLPDEVFDTPASQKPLGCIPAGERYDFRLFAPRARAVELRVFDRLDDEIGTSHAMDADPDGVWELSLPAAQAGRYYAYLVESVGGPGTPSNAPVLVADPYARNVVTKNTYHQEARAVIPAGADAFDWGDDKPVRIAPRDLVIYEMHVKDMTAHASSGADEVRAGTYLGLTQQGARGGVEYIASLGVNAVELMPVHHFAHIELPYMQHAADGSFNTWNPYERNHWGYMTSYFFAPEPTFATGAISHAGLWNDTEGRHLREFKEAVKAFHAAGIAVILDVVYNHTSQYDNQPLKHIDALYYYRTDGRGGLTNGSGCGNDLHTARPMARRLIIDSIVHWLTEYHVDGFRFDLAALIDDETFLEIGRRARAINPDVVLIAEPWGGGAYDLARFARFGMLSWNDVFRNGVKGVSPSARGFLFGSWGWNSPESFGQWVLGSVHEKSGPFPEAAHCVNYLAAHDGYTLGDFIRIACGDAKEHHPIRDTTKNAILSSTQLRYNRLAAFMLFVCQGAVMLHHGQEFGRSKVVARRKLRGTTPGVLDHNSYEKDDETNWINWLHADLNLDLIEYYRGLIALRAALRPLRHATADRYRFLTPDADIASGFIIAAEGDHGGDIAVLVNANHSVTARYTIPDGDWCVITDGDRAGATVLRHVKGGIIEVAAGTGMVLVRAGGTNTFIDGDTAH